MTTHPQVTASTKCWDGDYRTVLTAPVLDDLFRPLGAVARRQVVLNRITDRAHAEELAAAAVAAGTIDAFAWAEDAWPALSHRLRVPLTWFGPAWPYAVPELTELALAETPVLVHIAGDVRLDDGEPWLARAVPALDRCEIVAPISPSRVEVTRGSAESGGWVRDHDFSDQCYLARPDHLLAPEVVRATHPANGRYPKPGGALTFEARVGAWLRMTGRARLLDLTRTYRHPVGGTEGGSYADLRGPVEELPPLPAPSPAYPAPRSVPGTGLVVARNAVRSIAWTVASLRWLEDVVVVDQASDDGTAERAAAAGARVRSTTAITGTGNALRGQITDEVGGWVVHLDADEVCPPGLAAFVATAVADDDVDVVEAATITHLLGREVRTRDRWPVHAVRALRAGTCTFPQGIETVRTPVVPRAEARVRRAPADAATAVVKLGSPDLHALVARANDRTTLEARGTWLDGGNPSARRAAKRLLTRLLQDGGWRMGRAGWRLAVIDAFTHWLLTEKAFELISGGATSVRAHYDEIAATVVEGRVEGSSVRPEP